MARRRDNRKRRRRRRGRRGGAGALLTFFALVLIIAAVVAALTIFFKIQKVTVTGESRYPAAELAAASGIETGRNMFLFNKIKAIEGLFAQYPYLDEISIRRHLPDTVDITVTECQPMAVLHSLSEYTPPKLKATDEPVTTVKEEYYLIDIKGKLLELVDAEAGQNYCLIEGASLKNPAVGKYASFAEEQKQKPLFLVLNSLNDHDILLNVDLIDITETYNISFRYTHRFLVKIGSVDELEKKIDCMNAVIDDERVGANDVGIIDVSSPGTAVRFIKGSID